MVKQISKGDQVVFYGVDLSDLVEGWAIHATLGELVTMELDLVLCNVIEIVRDDDLKRITPLGARFAYNDKILINGVDVRNHIYRYEIITHVGKVDTIRLFIQCDSEVLSVNGQTPWEQRDADS